MPKKKGDKGYVTPIPFSGDASEWSPEKPDTQTTKDEGNMGKSNDSERERNPLVADDSKYFEGLKALRAELGALTPSFHEGQVMRRVLVALIDHVGGDELADVLSKENPLAASGKPAAFGSQGDAIMVSGSVSGPGELMPGSLGNADRGTDIPALESNEGSAPKLA